VSTIRLPLLPVTPVAHEASVGQDASAENARGDDARPSGAVDTEAKAEARGEERRDPAPYIAAIRDFKDEKSEKMLEFITAARSSTNPADAEPLLDGLSLDARGQAYSAALVVLGTRAPAEWRRGADRLLFVPERPYFSQVI